MNGNECSSGACKDYLCCNVQPEVCDGADNDCDGETDEDDGEVPICPDGTECQGNGGCVAE